MLFISYIFLFGFLPGALLVFYGLRRLGLKDASVASLMVASLVFYSYWRPSGTFLLIGTIIVNFFVAKYLGKVRKSRSKLLLVFGISVNLGLLVYFKYFVFLAANVATVGGFEYVALHC